MSVGFFRPASQASSMSSRNSGFDASSSRGRPRRRDMETNRSKTSSTSDCLTGAVTPYFHKVLDARQSTPNFGEAVCTRPGQALCLKRHAQPPTPAQSATRPKLEQLRIYNEAHYEVTAIGRSLFSGSVFQRCRDVFCLKARGSPAGSLLARRLVPAGPHVLDTDPQASPLSERLNL